MWALIVGGRVHELTAQDPAGRFHPSMHWVQCDASVVCGDHYDGEGFSPPSQPQAPPVMTVTARQIRLAMNALGIRAQVEAAVAAADQNTRDEWEYATEIRRDWPAFVAMAAALGKTDAEIDALFNLARAL